MAVAALLRHPVIREWLLISVLLIAASVAALRWEWFARLDDTLYDKAIELIRRPPQKDIVIIGIDEESLRRIGRFPWPRAVHATLIEILAAARPAAIGYDVAFTETDQRDLAADVPLAAALARNGRVVLPVIKSVEEGVIFGEALPVASLAAAAAGLAQIDAESDADGILRVTYLRAGFREARYSTLALAMLNLAEPAKWNAQTRLPGVPHRATGDKLWVRDYLYQVPYAGSTGHFNRISFADVLVGDYPDKFFDGKLVLVGPTASGLRDEYPTPVSGQTSSMPGVEIHANILQGLREGIDIYRIDALWSGALTIAMLLCVMLTYLWLSPRRSLLLTLGAIAFTLLGSAMLFRFSYWWFSPVGLASALLLAYPLWSWRKLEATQRFFDEELSRLENEPVVVPQEAVLRIAPQNKNNAFVPGVIENRIATLQTAAQRMRDLNRFVADSLESVPEVVLVTDSAGRILFANTSATERFAAFALADPTIAAVASLEGSDIFSALALLRHGDTRTWQEIWAEAYGDMKPISLEAKGANDDEFLLQLAPSFSARGERTGSIVTLVDVSPLRESERRRDEALRFLSHDMRSPQASILTLLEMQKEDPESMPVTRLVERIGKYSRRTLNLADDFLRLANAERAKAQDFVSVQLDELIRDAADEAWSLASTKNIVVKATGDPSDAWVKGDRDLLTRTIINLLSNAIKYSPPNTQVSLNLARDGDKWIVSVIDQGYGIAEADMSKLFQRFTRLKHEGQPEEDGIGLGLVFVKTVIERHHGSIKVSSKITPGDSGTTFALTIPATAPEVDE